jgi:hypothetical protein
MMVLSCNRPRPAARFSMGRKTRPAAGTASLVVAMLLTACSGVQEQMAELGPRYAALPDHKAMVFNADNSRLAWVSGKGSQLDAIQLAEILCTRASMNPDECRMVDVDGHRLYDPVSGTTFPPDSDALADVLYEAGVPAKIPAHADSESSCFLGLFC